MKRYGYRLSVFLLLLLNISLSFALTVTENTKKTQPIVGYAPFMSSIGAKIDLNGHYLFDEQSNPILSVNTRLYVPSINCQFTHQQIANNQLAPEQLAFFHFSDADKDECRNQVNNHLSWYILDTQGKAWESITAWDDLQASPITGMTHPGSTIPAGEITDSPYTQGLVVPAAAVGQRIGFTFTPYANTGNPEFGLPIKVWDLNYFFGQDPYNYTGTPIGENDGKKVSEITAMSAGGTVMAPLNRPQIYDLVMAGTFLANESIEAKYEFAANTTSSYEEHSRFWWGPFGTTWPDADFQNPNYSRSPISPKLTENDIGSVYELTVLPVKKESGIYVVGRSVTVLSDDPNNQFTSPPRISNLRFNQDIMINESVNAMYDFSSGISNPTDRSSYIWQVKSGVEDWRSIASGNVTQSGLVPDSPNIDFEYAGMTLGLTVTPRNVLDQVGQPVLISSLIESIIEIKIEPTELYFAIGDTRSLPIQVFGVFASGEEIELTQEGTWQSDTDGINVSPEGLVSITSAITQEMIGSVTFTYGSRPYKVPVHVEANLPSIKNLRFTSLLNDEVQVVLEPVYAAYEFDNGGHPESIDQSTYILYVGDRSVSSGTVQASGVINALDSLNPEREGLDLTLHVTPRDQFGREGITEIITIPTSKVVSVEIDPIDIYFLVTTKMTATATLSTGQKIDATEHGEWASPSEPYVFIKGNEITMTHALVGNNFPSYPPQVIIEFDFGIKNRIAYTEKRVSILTTNISQLYGTETEHVVELTKFTHPDGTFHTWGDDLLLNITDEAGNILVGGPGGVKCGRAISCNLNFGLVTPGKPFEMTYRDNGFSSIAWSVSGNTDYGGFWGNIGLEPKWIHNIPILSQNELFGIIFYGSDEPNTPGAKITGLRYIFRTER